MRKIWAAAGAALIVLCGSIVSIGIMLTQRAELLRGWEIATQPTTPLPFAVPRPGVNVDLTQYDANELAVQLADMADLGVMWVRQTFSWEAIEPQQGLFQWEQWDNVVRAVQMQDSLRLVAVLNFSPQWARHPLASDSLTAPPSNHTDFARFAQVFAARYGDAIDHYQIWDEPNLEAAWGHLEPKAADYTALLQAAYTAIHAADPQAVVITAGLAPTIETGPRNYSEVLFLRAIYENGGGAYFDAVAGKPYGFDTGPNDRRVQENILNFSRIVLLREEMLRHGDGHKAIWATQFGWNTLPDDWTGPPSLWGSVTRDEQFNFTHEAYVRAAREWPWMAGMIVRHWQPEVAADDPQWGFSLIPPGETRIQTPGLFLTEESEVAGVGRHQALTLAARYSGEWEFGDLGADFGQRDDSEVQFTFTGTALALELRRDNYRAYLYVTVDGVPANALPLDNAGRSYVILTSEDRQPHTDVIILATGLSPGEHTAHIRAERGWDQWALAAFRVAVQPQVNDDAAVLLLAVVALFSVVAFIISVRKIVASRQFHFRLMVFERISRGTQVVLGLVASIVMMLGMLLTWQDALPSLLRRDMPGLAVGILTAGLLYFSNSLLLAVLAGILLFVIVYNRLEIGLFLTLFWAPFYLYPLELFQFAFPMAEVCVFITFVAWILQRVITWAVSYRAQTGPATKPFLRLYQQFSELNTFDWAMLALCVAALLTITWSGHRAEAWREWRMMVLGPALFYLMTRTSIREMRAVLYLVDGLVAAAAVAAAIGIVLYFNGQGIITAEGGIPRLAGVYGSPNNVGLIVGRALPFALAFVLLPTSAFRRGLAAAAGVMMLVAALLSHSGGALLLGLPVAIVVVLLLWQRRRGLIISAGLVLTGIAALIPLSQSPRFARLLDFSSGTSFFRVKLWQSAITMIREQPLRGYGLDQFLYQYRGRYILPEAWQEPDLSHPHNILLDFWIRLGILGVLLFIWLQVLFWRGMWCMRRQFEDGPAALRAVYIGAIGSMAALLAHGLVDNSVFVFDLSYVFVLLIALPGVLDSARNIDRENVT